MIEDALSVLRAEVQVDPTGRPNLVPNPSGDGGSWFWVTPLRFTKISSVAGALRISTGVGVGDAYTQTNPIRVAAGDWIAARFDTVGGTAGHKVKARFRFFDLAGNLIDTSTATAGFDTTPGTHYRPAVQAPAGTSYAKLKLDLYDGASPPAAGAHYDFNNVMVTTDAATFGIPFAFTEPVEYTNILGPTNNITITRGAMEPGVIGVRVIDTSLDPADADALRTGRLFRITALNDDTDAFEDLSAGLYILRAVVNYDLSKPPEKQAVISLALTDSLQLLANSVRPVSVGTMDELPFVLETVGIPFIVNGNTGTLIDDPVVTARLDQATALDQVLLTRDSNLAYAWISKSGVFNGWTDRGTAFYGGPVTFDESSYSDIDVSFDTDNCINEVVVVRVVINPASGETIEKTYGPFRDEAAVDRWKVVRQATFRVTGISEADVVPFAASVLADRAEPARRVNSLTVPIRTPEDITTAKALIDLYATANIINTAKGIDLDQQITAITHNIQCTAKGVRWVMTLGFDVAESVSSPAPVTGASGAAGVTVQHGSRVPEFWNTDTVTATTDDADVTLALTYIPDSQSLFVRQNGVLLEADEYTLSGSVVTIAPSADVVIRAGQQFSAYYVRYTTGDADPTVLVDWASTGPLLLVAEGDATDHSTDDDADWSVAPGPYGWPVAPPDPYWPIPPATDVGGSANVGFWIRRPFTVVTSGDYDISGRVDGQHWLYLDGVLIHSYAGPLSGVDNNFTVAAQYLSAGPHEVAFHVNDDVPEGPPDYIYGDVRVEKTP